MSLASVCQCRHDDASQLFSVQTTGVIEAIEHISGEQTLGLRSRVWNKDSSVFQFLLA